MAGVAVGVADRRAEAGAGDDFQALSVPAHDGPSEVGSDGSGSTGPIMTGWAHGLPISKPCAGPGFHSIAER